LEALKSLHALQNPFYRVSSDPSFWFGFFSTDSDFESGLSDCFTPSRSSNFTLLLSSLTTFLDHGKFLTAFGAPPETPFFYFLPADLAASTFPTNVMTLAPLHP